MLNLTVLSSSILLQGNHTQPRDLNSLPSPADGTRAGHLSQGYNGVGRGRSEPSFQILGLKGMVLLKYGELSPGPMAQLVEVSFYAPGGCGFHSDGVRVGDD